MSRLFITIIVVFLTMLSLADAELCSGESMSVKIDLAPGIRITAGTELICYSAEWVVNVPSGAVVLVEVNGEALRSSEGSGYVEWAPITNGTYTLTHQVMSGGMQYGETLMALFLVDGMPESSASTPLTPGMEICSGESESINIDLTPGIRSAMATETIRYSAEWEDGVPSVATAVVEVNGETMNASAGTGFLNWTPPYNGTFILTHKVISGETQYGETLVATFACDWRTVETPVIEPSDMTFDNVSQVVSISCATEGATILYTTDGSDPAVNGLEYRNPFSVYSSCTIRAIAVKNDWKNSSVATSTLVRSESLSEAANSYGYKMETDTVVPWSVVTDVSHDGVSCVRSGVIGHGCTTWLQTSVRKAGTVSFWWKAACEEAEEEDGETYWYDYGSFWVDGAVKAQIAGNDTGWQFVSVDVPSGGKHTLRWEYTKDDATTYSPDCIWLDQVQWIPADGSGHTLTTPDPVPYSWLSSYGLGLDSDFESAAKRSIGKQSGSGRAWQVWQDYVAGTDPTNVTSAFTASIEMKDGMPLVTWSPNLNSNGEVRVYTVMGKVNLTDAVWQSPTNSAHRFFKVKVELP